MTPSKGSLPAAYFDAVYAASDDPWSFETSPYEAGKYQATLAALGGRRFDRALEVGCSIGVLTAMLAPWCRELLAVDVSEAALAGARARCAALQHVQFACVCVPDAFPPGRFDLVMTSEVAYYWSPADLARAAEAIEAGLVPGGLWLLVHWTPVVDDYPQTGDAVHDAIIERSAKSGALRHRLGRRHETYRLDLFERAPADRGAR